MNIEKILQKIAIEREKKKLEGLRRVIILLSVLLIGIFIGNFIIQDNFNLQLTGFAASGSLPTVGGNTGTWGGILNTYLQQEHTSAGGHKNVTVEGSLDVGGNGNFTGNIIADNLTDSSGGIISIPSGFVGFFNTTACPTGWNEMQEAVGRTFVAINTTGTLGATIGTALSDNENRAVGQHNHGVTDPGHSHNVDTLTGDRLNFGTGSSSDSGNTRFALNAVSQAERTTGTQFSESGRFVADSQSTGITTNTNGSVSGTNAPYIQVLVCVKT